MQQILNGKEMVLGTCYYPEHWERTDWEPDMRRMLAHGIKVIRVAEFAWSKVEPQEGIYCFNFWDDFLDTAHRIGMKVIFSTPTATPPAWLTEAYPEVLNVDINGARYYHGNRQHANHTSEKYIELSRKIVEKLAQHYGKHPAIIGWQLDNEFNCSLNEFYAESDDQAFRKFVKNKYETIEALNDAWGTVFWNQTYTDWQEVHIPRKVPLNAGNPHQQLDYIRFISESTCEYAQMQSDIIKKYKKADDFITTNGIFGNLDSHRLTRESLNFFMYDSYPDFAYEYDGNKLTGLKDRKWSRNLSVIRSISPVFGIMEQQAGAVGWNTGMESCAPRPGQMSLWTIQSIAHGADYISFFRWRTSIIGTEIYWHGLLDYSGRENRRMRELQALYANIEKLNEVAGGIYQASVAVLKDYDNEWDSQIDVWHNRVETCSKDGIYTAAQLTHTPLDYVYLTETTSIEELASYKVLFYPHASILTMQRVQLLEEYVRGGGILVFGCRTGYKEIHGKCVRALLPGLARELTGTDVEEYSFVPPDETEIYADWKGSKLKVSVFMDMLNPMGTDTVILARYGNGMYEGEGALTERSLGKGKVYYFGGAFDEQTTRIFLNRLRATEPYGEVLGLPECCELAVRKKEDTEYLFVLNYTKDAVQIDVKEPLYNLYTGENWEGIYMLPGYGTLVFRRMEQ